MNANDPVLEAIGVLFVAALGLALMLTPLSRVLALKCRMVDVPGERKIHQDDKPYGGGIAIMITLTLVLGVTFLALLIFDFGRFSINSDFGIGTLQKGLTQHPTLFRFAAVFGGGVIMFCLGIIDDVRGVRARVKLIVQILAALLLVAADIRATVFLQHAWLSTAVTVLWVVAVTNAFNLLDNMDGLSAGIAAIAAFCFLTLLRQNYLWETREVC